MTEDTPNAVVRLLGVVTNSNVSLQRTGKDHQMVVAILYHRMQSVSLSLLISQSLHSSFPPQCILTYPIHSILINRNT